MIEPFYFVGVIILRRPIPESLKQNYFLMSPFQGGDNCRKENLASLTYVHIPSLEGQPRV